MSSAIPMENCPTKYAFLKRALFRYNSLTIQFTLFFLAAPMVYRSFQARDQIQTTAATRATAVATPDP